MKNARIDWFRAVRVFNFGLGWQAPCSGGRPATIGTPFGRDAELLPCCGRKGVLHGSERGPHTPIAGNLSLPGLVFLFAISLIPFTPWNGAKADTPAVTDIRIGFHDFGTRLVLDLNSGGASYVISEPPEDGTVSIQFPNIDWYPATERLLNGALIDSYAFALVGATGGRLRLVGAQPLIVINSFPLSPSGGSGHRLVFDLAESSGVPPAAAEPRRRLLRNPLRGPRPPDPLPKSRNCWRLCPLPSMVAM